MNGARFLVAPRVTQTESSTETTREFPRGWAVATHTIRRAARLPAMKALLLCAVREPARWGYKVRERDALPDRMFALHGPWGSVPQPQVQEYVVSRRDLRLFLGRLQQADCLFHRFSTVTTHSLDIDPHSVGFRYPEIMSFKTHTNAKGILATYWSELNGFTDLTLEHVEAPAGPPPQPGATTSAPRRQWHDHAKSLKLGRTLRDKVAAHRVPEMAAVVRELEERLARGRQLVERGEFLAAPEEEFKPALAKIAWIEGRGYNSQMHVLANDKLAARLDGLVWEISVSLAEAVVAGLSEKLESKPGALYLLQYRGVETQDGRDEVWRLGYSLMDAWWAMEEGVRCRQWRTNDAQSTRHWCCCAKVHRLDGELPGWEFCLALCATLAYTSDEKLLSSVQTETRLFTETVRRIPGEPS